MPAQKTPPRALVGPEVGQTSRCCQQTHRQVSITELSLCPQGCFIQILREILLISMWTNFVVIVLEWGRDICTINYPCQLVEPGLGQNSTCCRQRSIGNPLAVRSCHVRRGVLDIKKLQCYKLVSKLMIMMKCLELGGDACATKEPPCSGRT